MSKPKPEIRNPTFGRRRRRAAGFTLIEAALTTVIVGTGVLAIVAAQQAYHMKNNWAQRTGTAMLLANEVREMTLTLPMYDPLHGTASLGTKGDDVASFTCVADFAGPLDGDGRGEGLAFHPPINAMRDELPDYERWRQQVRVHSVLPDHISATYTQPLGTTNLLRVRVDVEYRSHSTEEYDTVTSLTWLVTK
ncbi:MAG: hypothetical protein WD118_00565 [Phycisphaeraceae bacterium]